MPSSRENAESWSAGPGTHRVLIVDDEVVIRRALSRYFARRGWVVLEAGDGDAARRALADVHGEEHVDLVICDLRMPQGSGEELYRWLERHRPELAGRVVFSSGDVLAPEAAAFLAEARRPVLPKPFDLRDIARVIDEVRGSARAG